MDITHNIKSIRESKKVSQAEMARKLDLDPAAYFRIEKRGDKLSVEQLKNISEVLGVSVLELLTGEPQTRQDSELVKGLKKKVDELEDIVKLYRGNLYSSERELERLRQYFTNAIYENIAEMSIQRGYSKLRFYHVGTGKTLIALTIPEFEKKYQDELKALKDVIKFRSSTNKESTKTEGDGITEETRNNFSLHTMSYIIANEYKIKSWDISSEFVLIDEFRQKAVNFFFYKWLIEGSNLDLIDIVFGSGIIIDNTLLTTYNDAKSLEVEIMAEGTYLTEDLELTTAKSAHT